MANISISLLCEGRLRSPGQANTNIGREGRCAGVSFDGQTPVMAVMVGVGQLVHMLICGSRE